MNIKTKTYTLRFTALLVAVLFTLPVSTFAQEEAPEPAPLSEEAQSSPADIVSTLEAEDNYSTFVAMLKKTGLDQTLASEKGPYTAFAPTDDAFAALPEGTLESWGQDKLAGVLRHHVIPGQVTADKLAQQGTVANVEGSEIDVGEGTVGDAAIVQADIEASNGVIHGIDTVLTPSTKMSMNEPSNQ